MNAETMDLSGLIKPPEPAEPGVEKVESKMPRARAGAVMLFNGFLLVLAFAIGLGLGLYWLAAHLVVRSERGVALVEKRYLSFDGPWVDLRGWDAADFAVRPEIKRALYAGGYGELVVEPAPEPIVGKGKEWEERMNRFREETAAEYEAWWRSVRQGSEQAAKATRDYGAEIMRYWAEQIEK